MRDYLRTTPLFVKIDGLPQNTTIYDMLDDFDKKSNNSNYLTERIRAKEEKKLKNIEKWIKNFKR